MATKVFDSIKQAAGDREKSLTWYRGKVKSLMDNVTKNKLMRGKLFATPQPNGLNFFRYNPKLASILPYYDVFPLVLPIQSARGGFLGINFHYLPIPLRMKLFETLEKKDFKGDYRALKNIREIKPTIKHYLRSQMASKFLRLDEEEFAPAIFLPVQDFRKAGTSTVHAASRRMI
tara:strand:- start:1427 stop:1951 length:525 start_codon:yes stop_codon:yes gene_type:complete